MSDLPQKREEREIPESRITSTALTPIDASELTERRNTVKQAMTDVMTEGVHYGSVGNVDRSVLLKPGAEVLANLFNLGAEPDKIEIEKMPEIGPGHREYHVDVRLFHIPTGQTVGIGTASCSTAETKYRFRWEYYSIDVPTEYWNSGEDGSSRDESLLWDAIGEKPEINLPGFTEIEPVKSNGSWSKIRVRRENPTLADTYNTVKKMAKKRSLIDGILTVLGVSALFTQDVDEEHIGPESGSAPDRGQGTGGQANRPNGQATAGQGGQNAKPRPDEPYIEREDEEGRFERVGQAARNRLRRMDLFLLRSGTEELPNNLNIVKGAISNGATKAAAYAHHLMYLHRQRIDAPTSKKVGYPSDKQVGLLYGRGGDYGWSNEAVERLVKVGWEFNALELIPSREVFDEILLQFEDERLREVFSSEPDSEAFQNGGDPRDEVRGRAGGQEAAGGQEPAEEPAEPDPLPESLRYRDLLVDGGITDLTTLRRRVKDGTVTDVNNIGEGRASMLADELGVEFDSVNREEDFANEDFADEEGLPPGMK